MDLLKQLQRVRYKFNLDRKSVVLRYIKKNKPLKILEIGVFNGEFAIRMLSAAKKVDPKSQIIYYGIDLFEDITEDDLLYEVSPLPLKKHLVKEVLSNLKCEIILLQGKSDAVLQSMIGKTKFDLIIIDGGHSELTVAKDWFWSQKLLNKNGAVFFDDYTNKKGEMNGYGVKRVVDQISKVKYVTSRSWNIDFFRKDYGVLSTRMVKVQIK